VIARAQACITAMAERLDTLFKSECRTVYAVSETIPRQLRVDGCERSRATARNGAHDRDLWLLA
jgi:hypothetical protein